MAKGERAVEEAEEEYESDLDGAPIPAARRRAAARADDNDEEEEYESDLDGAPLPAPRRRAAASDDEEENEEYESGLDDAPLPAARRRASASDDKEDEGGATSTGGRGSPAPSEKFGSDSDEQGASELYDDEEEAYGTEEDEECEDVYDEFDAGGGEGGGEAETVKGEVAVALDDEGKCEEEEAAAAGVEEDVEEAAAVRVMESKMGAEPYAVPTIGPFYMHDNRFQDKENWSRGQRFGDKKIWYPKDEVVWVHDRFEEINFHDSQKDNAGMHNIDHGYPKRMRSYNGTKSFDNVLMQSLSYDGNAKGYNNHKDEAVWLHDRFHEINCHDAQHDNVRSHSYGGNAKGYNNGPNVHREKASRTYQSHWTSSRISSAQNNRSKHTEASSNAAEGKHSYQTSTPTPFNSSRSYHQDPPISQREKARVVKFSKLFSSAVRMAHNSLKPQSYPILRKKASVPSGEHGNAVDPCCMVPAEVMPRSALHSVSTSGNCRKYSESYNQGKDLDIAGSASNTIYFTSSPAARPYAQPHNVVYQQRPVQQPILPARKAFAQILGQKSSGTNKIQSHPQTTLTSSAKDGDVTTTTPTEPNVSAVLSEVKGHDMEETERTFSDDAGDHVLSVSGASGFTLADKGSIDIPAKLPVMLFRGPGFPSVARALPGFAGQQLGGNSKMGLMTWLPILTDATVALEGTHTSPCISTNRPQFSELEYPSALPRDHSATKDPISLSSQETPGNKLVGHQNRPRRFSEMSFAL